MKILLFEPNPESGITYYRTLTPLYHLRDMLEIDVIEEIDPQDILNGEFDEYDVIYFNRILVQLHWVDRVFDYLESKNIKTVCDIDDWWFPNKKHPSYNNYVSHKIYNWIIRTIYRSTCVFTPSTTLKKEIEVWNNDVYLIPNAISETETQFIRKNLETDRFRVGWAGGSSHLQDIEVLKPSIELLHTTKLINGIQIVLCGFNLDGVDREKLNSATYIQIEKILSNNYQGLSKEYKDYLLRYTNDKYMGDITKEPYHRIWSKPIREYGDCYNYMDVSLAPLNRTFFNECKSNIKFIESSVNGIPTIGQKNQTYLTNNIDSSLMCFVDYEKPNDFYEYIKKLMLDKEFYDSIKTKSSDFVRIEYSLEEINIKRLDILKKLIN